MFFNQETKNYIKTREKYRKNALEWEELNDFYDTRNPFCKSHFYPKTYYPAKTVKELQIRENRAKPYDMTWEQMEEYLISHKLPRKEYDFVTLKNVYYPAKLVNQRCHQWNCPECRKNKLRNLYYWAGTYGYIFGLDNHIVYTFKGLAERLKHGYIKSYKIMREEIHKLNRYIDYDLKRVRKTGDLKLNLLENPIILPKYAEDLDLKNLYHQYINLNRAQSNPEENNPIGFSHIHGLDNIPFNPNYLKERIKKADLKIGFTFTKYHNAINYLTTDFFNKKELVIPYKMRLYTSTRGININMKYKKETWSETFTDNVSMDFIEYHLKNGAQIYEVFGEKMTTLQPEILPFEEYVKQFYNIIKKEE